MKKIINPKNKELYDYMVEANKKILTSGKDIEPTCYSIVFNKKNDFAIVPIPLSANNTQEHREKMLFEVNKILNENKVKVNMFLLVTTAWVFKKREMYDTSEIDSIDNKKECLLFSAIDSIDNKRYTMFEISRKDKIVDLRLMEDCCSKGWEIKEITKPDKHFEKATLLDSIWKMYRSLRKA